MMISSKETSLTSKKLIENDPLKIKNIKNTYFKTIYLCIEKVSDPQYIYGFNCYTFQDLNHADKFYRANFTDIEKKRHIIVSVSNLIPSIFHKYFINQSLKKIYWKNDIAILKNVKYY